MFEMALETYYDSNFNLAAANEGFLQSSSSDNSPEEHEQYQAAAASLLNASSENLPSSGISNLNVGIVHVDRNQAIGSNSRASSLATDANLAFLEGPNIHRSAISIVDSDPNLLALPSSMAIDGACVAQQNFHLGPKKPQVAKKKQQQQKGFTALSPTGSQKHQNALLSGLKQEHINVTKRFKKPRMDVSEETFPDRYISPQLGQSQETVQLQTHAQVHQLSGLIQHHMNRNAYEQKVSHSVPLPQSQSVPIQLQNQEMRYQLQLPVVHQVSNAHQLDGMCTRRLMQYIHNLRRRPLENRLDYWRQLIEEYFSPSAKKRWCVSLYDKAGLEAMSIFRHAAMDGWQCDVCGCKSGRGFEANFEVLPRLNKLAIETGVVDELLFLDLPQEYRFPSGLTMLKCEKAVQESVHENLRVVHQGQLQIVFTHDLKILSWEFCASGHEVFLLQSLVVSQVVRATQKYQSSINPVGSNGRLPQFSQANGNRIQAAGCWLANALDLQPVDGLGFPKRYTRCLQMAEIVQSLKDLMSFSQTNQIGPIESLKNYCRDIGTSKLQTAELQVKRHLQGGQNIPKERSMPVFPVVGLNASGGSNVARESLVTASEPAAYPPPDHNHKLAFPGPKISSSILTNNFTANGLSSSPTSSQTTDQCVIQKILQEMLNSRTANEVQRPVANLPTRMYYSPEAASAPGTSNSWAADKMNFSESAASDPSSTEDQI